MIRHTTAAMILAACGTAVAAADPERFTARVVSVHDGDKCHVLDDDREVRVRLVADAGLAAAEIDARAAGRGLWGDPEPVAPWDWRATEKARKAAQREPTGR